MAVRAGRGPHPDAAILPFHDMTSRGCYLLNLALLLVLVALAVTWFHKHLEPYFARSMFVGSAFSLWALWKMLQVAVKKLALKQTGGNHTQAGLLHERRATEYLILSLVMVVWMYSTTSSIYFVHGGTAASYDVATFRGVLPYIANHRVSSTEAVVGRPFFFRFRTDTVAFRIDSPGGWEPITRVLRPWSGLRVRVPGDFTPTKYYLLHLVPSSNLRRNLPLPKRDTGAVTYRLKLIVGADTSVHDDLRQSSIYYGVSGSELDRMKLQAADGMLAAMRAHYVNLGFPSDEAQSVAETLQAAAIVVSGPALTSGDSVHWFVYRSTAEQPVAMGTFLIANDGVLTRFVEMDL